MGINTVSTAWSKQCYCDARWPHNESCIHHSPTFQDVKDTCTWLDNEGWLQLHLGSTTNKLYICPAHRAALLEMLK